MSEEIKDMLRHKSEAKFPNVKNKFKWLWHKIHTKSFIHKIIIVNELVMKNKTGQDRVVDFSTLDDNNKT